MQKVSNERNILREIGFKKGWIYETIITTSDEKKIKNAAPIGIWTKNFSDIEMEIYRDMKTCRNILATNEFVVNLIDDIEIFYNAIYAKDKIKYKKAENVDAPVLRDAKNWLELRVKEKKFTHSNKKVKISSKIISFTLKDKEVKLLNRAKHLTLESIIKTTRIPYRKLKEKERLMNDIKENLRVIKKVAPNAKYERIIKKIFS